MSLTGRISTITPQSHHHPSTISASTFLPLRRTNTVSFRPSTTFLNPILKPQKITTIITRNHTPRKTTSIKMSMEAGIGLMGTKLGMMTYFEPTGKVVPVTVIGFKEGNVVTQVKTDETDGYNAVQVGYRRVRDKKLTKPEMGHLEKAGVIPLRHLQEFRLQNVDGFEANQKLVLEELFKEGDLVDVSGTTIGKGFQGGIKRHNFKRGQMTHGSKSHRALGSIGAGTTPGRVYPGKKMPGRMGGHTGSWAEAYPEIVACANMFWWPAGAPWEERLAAEPGTGHLNPLVPKTYEVVKNVINDVAALFPDSFFHGGADEVVPGCWKADPTIQKYLANNGTLSQVLEIFINNTHPYILSQNRTAVYWEDVILDAEIKINPSILPPETTIMQTWNGGPNNTKRLVSAGYRTIVSSSDFYYLDCGHGDCTGNNTAYDQPPGFDQEKGGSWCGPFKTWQLIYNYDITYGLNETEAKLVIGGEVALWSEQADATVLDSRIWPRASALGEVLWSGNRDETGKKRSADATDRLSEWINRMVSRGVKAEPIQPLWCIRNPGMCNTANPIF